MHAAYQDLLNDISLFLRRRRRVSSSRNQDGRVVQSPHEAIGRQLQGFCSTETAIDGD